MPEVPEGLLRGAGGGPAGRGVRAHLEGPPWGGGPLLLVLLVTASWAVCTSTPEVCPQLMYVAGNSYYPYVLGLYILQSEPHQDKPYYSHACHEAYIYYHPPHAAWWVGPELGAPSGYALLEGETLTGAGGAGGAPWRYWSQSERRWFYDTGVKLVCLNISCQRFAMSSQRLPAFVSEEFHLGDVIYYDRPVYVNSASGFYLYHSHRSHDCHVWQIGAHVGDEQGFMYIRSNARNPLDLGNNWILNRTEGSDDGSAESEESLDITITCIEYYQYYNNDTYKPNTQTHGTTVTVGREVTGDTTSQTDMTSQTRSSSPTESTESIYGDTFTVPTTGIPHSGRTGANNNYGITTSTTYTIGSGMGREEEVRTDPEAITTTASSEEIITSPSTQGVSTVGNKGDVTSSSPTGSDVEDVLTTPSGKATTDSSLLNRDITTVAESIGDQQTALPTTNSVTDTDEDVTTTRLPDVTEGVGPRDVVTSGHDVTTSSTSSEQPRTTPSGLPTVCGQRIPRTVAASFLVSGTDSAYQGRWPSMVAILRADNRTKCGAALVTDRYLVTAAHCIDGSNSSMASYRVVLGANNRDVTEPGVLYRYIRRVILHTNFTYTTSPFRISQDVGLVELDSPVAFSRYIQPLCLPEAAHLALPFPRVTSNLTNCYMTGFGYMHVDATGTKTSLGGVLQEQLVTLSPISSCARRYYGRYPWLSSSDNLCVHPRNYAKLCSGDSGSPLMCRQGSEWTLVGVASWTFAACIGSNFPSVYVDLRLHADWIRQQIANSQSASASQKP